MGYRVLLLRDVHESGKKLFEEHDCEIVVAKGTELEDYLQELRVCDALLVRNEHVTAKMMDEAGNLKVIAKHGVGYDNIDVEYATKKGIRVVYAPMGNMNSVADMAMLHILGCARRLRHTQNEFYNGNYDVRFQMADTHQLFGKVLGVVGCGKIARGVAKRAKYGFGMRVIGYDAYIKPGMLDCGIEVLEERDEIFKQADFVSIHLPSTSNTIHSIGMREFGLMKKTAYVINTARGNILCEEELIQALEQKIIAGAGLDVFETEPVEAGHPLLKMEQVLVTPHCSGLTEEASEEISRTAAMGILEVLYNKEVTWPVNEVK